MFSVRPAVWVGPGGPGSGCVRKGISAQVSLYIWGTENAVQVDPHLGFLDSPRGLCFSSGGQAECCFVVLDCQTGGLVGQ